MAQESLGEGLTDAQLSVRQQFSQVQKVMQQHCTHNFHDPAKHGSRCPQCNGVVPINCSE